MSLLRDAYLNDNLENRKAAIEFGENEKVLVESVAIAITEFGVRWSKRVREEGTCAGRRRSTDECSTCSTCSTCPENVL